MEVSCNEVMKEVEKDIPFYEESGGGVTFSGGEPMLQIDFLKELLFSSKQLDINTAVDTTGYTDFVNFEKIYALTDLFLYDLKLMNSEKHIEFTGVSNNIILKNLTLLSQMDNKIILRIPIIPSITDTEENIGDMLDYISSLKNIRGITLLPFHKTADSKYEKMKMENKVSQILPPDNGHMQQLKKQFSSLCKNISIGG